MNADPSWQALLDIGLPVHRRHLDGDAWVDLEPGWCAAPATLFDRLHRDTPWGPQRTVRMYDRLVPEPRLTHRWPRADAPAELAAMARDLSGRYGVEFTQVGVNLYRDGADSVAWHGDRVARELPTAVVALVSLGAVRPFLLRPSAGGPSLALRRRPGTSWSWAGPASAPGSTPCPSAPGWGRGSASSSGTPTGRDVYPPRVHRKIGVMGGTFDPVHHGHLVAASEVADRFGLDEVVFVPTGQPWQKGDRVVSPAEERYLMTVVATASNPRFSVSRVDIDRDGPTYTVDTLRDLRTRIPDADLYFITGADALGAILTWRDVDELFALAHFVGVTRPGYVLEDDHLPAGAVTLVEVPAMAISSTDCRRRVAEGHPVWYLVPDGVVQYIAKRRLYREQGERP